MHATVQRVIELSEELVLSNGTGNCADAEREAEPRPRGEFGEPMATVSLAKNGA